MSPSQQWVVTPNSDTIYGAGFADLTSEAVVIQTPNDSPPGHYWTIQVTDVLTNVAAVLPRSFAARSEQSKARARTVLDQLGMYPLSEDQPAASTTR